MPRRKDQQTYALIEKKGWSIETLWPSLTATQKRYVTVAHRYETVADAAREIGVVPQTVYNWGPRVKAAVALFGDQVAQVALMELEDVLVEAAQVKVQEIRSPGSTKKLQQDAASEVLDRVLGRPLQSSQVAFKGEVEHTSPTFYIPENGREEESE
jgi:transposase-like protein